jgi:hypothetical protein
LQNAATLVISAAVPEEAKAGAMEDAMQDDEEAKADEMEDGEEAKADSNDAALGKEEPKDDEELESEMMWVDMWKKWHGTKPRTTAHLFYSDHLDIVRARTCVCDWAKFQRFLKNITKWCQCSECWYWYHAECVGVEVPDSINDGDDEVDDVDFTCRICLEKRSHTVSSV